MQHRLNGEHGAEKCRCAGYTPTALQMVQVIYCEPMGKAQAVFLHPLCHFFNAFALVALLAGQIDKQPLAH